jgi:predicted PurR-regulated permease PerM
MESKVSLDKLLRWGGIALATVTIFLIVKYLSAVLLPFFLAWFFAYLLYPVVKFVQYKMKVKIRALAIIITMLFTIAVIVGIIWLIIPPMISQFNLLGKFIGNYITQQTHSHSIMAYIQNLLQDNQQQLEQFFKSPNFAETMKTALPKVFSFVGQTANVIWSIVASCIIILYMFFILLDYEYLTNKWLEIFPKKARPFWADLMHDVERALNAYIRGQGMVAFCMGIMFCIGFTIIDFPMAIGLGILIGILDLVPYLHTFALIPTAFLALLKAADTGQNFWIIFGMAVAIFIIVQIISDFVVTPKILGKAMGLNPAVLLLALSVWGTLLGFIGLLLALPLTTLIFAYWKRFVTKDHEDEETLTITKDSEK